MKVLYVGLVVSLMIGMSGCQGAEPTTIGTSAATEKAKSPALVIEDQGSHPAPTEGTTIKNSVDSNPKVNEINDIASLIPQGWQLLVRYNHPEKAEGDLNKDGILDVAVVIEKIEAKKDEAPQRALLLAFGNKDGSYTPSITAEKAILKADEGGIWGDPLASISIDRGSIVVSFYGGSNFRWYGMYRFRFQNEDWYLIGATMGSFFTGTMTEENGDEEDYNLLTGDYVERVVDDPKAEKPTTHTIKGNIGKRELLRLRDFVASGSKDQFLK